MTDYYLQRVGFECDDVRLSVKLPCHRRTIIGKSTKRPFVSNRKRLLSLAAQKFVSDIAADAYQHARIRTNAQPAARGRAPAPDKATGTTGPSAPLKVPLSRRAPLHFPIG